MKHRSGRTQNGSKCENCGTSFTWYNFDQVWWAAGKPCCSSSCQSKVQGAMLIAQKREVILLDDLEKDVLITELFDALEEDVPITTLGLSDPIHG